MAQNALWVAERAIRAPLKVTKNNLLKRFRYIKRGAEVGRAHEQKSSMYVGGPTDHTNWRM